MKALVVGTGMMGRHHARVWGEMPGIELVGVADLDVDRAEAISARHGGTPFGDHRVALETTAPDVVSVCVPTSAHLTVARDCLEAGAAVLVEKPVTGSIEGAMELKTVAERTGNLLACGYVERFNPAVRVAREVIESGAIGDVTSLLVRRVGLMPSRITDTDVVRDLMVHDIDVCRFLLGGAMPQAVSASGGAALLSDRTDHAEALITFPGVGVMLQTNWITPVKVRGVVITGDRGYAEVDYLQQTVVIYRPRAASPDAEFEDFAEFLAASEGHIAETLQVPRHEPLVMELQAFAAAVRGEGTDIIGIDDALVTLDIAERVGRAIDGANV